MSTYLQECLIKSVLNYNRLSLSIDELVAEQSKLVLKAVEVLLKNTRFGTVKCINEVTSCVLEVQNVKNQNKHSRFANHLSAVASGILVVSCISMCLTHFDIKSVTESVRYYTNRIIRRDNNDVEWVFAWLNVLDSISNYKQYATSTTSLIALSDNQIKNCMPGNIELCVKKPSANEIDSEMLINTCSLSSVLVNNKPLVRLEGKHWYIKNQVDEPNLYIKYTEVNNTVDISNCTNSCIKIAGKIKAIIMDHCSKTAVMFDSLRSSIDIIDCFDIKVEALGKLPSLVAHRTTQCTIYLTKKSEDVEIITSNSTGVNVSMNYEGEDDIPAFAVPKQHKTMLVPCRRLQTRVVGS